MTERQFVTAFGQRPRPDLYQGILKLWSAQMWFSRPGNEGYAWFNVGLGVFSVLLALIVFALRWPIVRVFIKPEIGTTVSFKNDGLEVVRGRTPAARKPRFVPFAKIRNVLFTPDALHLIGGLSSGFWTIAIPRRVLVDDGGPVLAFLTEHLVSKRLLVPSSSMSTMLSNTASH